MWSTVKQRVKTKTEDYNKVGKVPLVVICIKSVVIDSVCTLTYGYSHVSYLQYYHSRTPTKGMWEDRVLFHFNRTRPSNTTSTNFELEFEIWMIRKPIWAHQEPYHVDQNGKFAKYRGTASCSREWHRLVPSFCIPDLQYKQYIFPGKLSKM